MQRHRDRNSICAPRWPHNRLLMPLPSWGWNFRCVLPSLCLPLFSQTENKTQFISEASFCLFTFFFFFCHNLRLEKRLLRVSMPLTKGQRRVAYPRDPKLTVLTSSVQCWSQLFLLFLNSSPRLVGLAPAVRAQGPRSVVRALLENPWIGCKHTSLTCFINNQILPAGVQLSSSYFLNYTVNFLDQGQCITFLYFPQYCPQVNSVNIHESLTPESIIVEVPLNIDV